MKTAQVLHRIADNTYQIRLDKINDLIDRCETAAKAGKYSVEVPTDTFSTFLNENEKTYLRKFGYLITTDEMHYNIYSDKLTQLITW